MRAALAWVLCLATLVALASGCGDKRESKAVLTSADVQKAFADQGLDLSAFTIGPGIPALGYPASAAGMQGQRVVCEIYDLPSIARGVVITIREKRPGNVSLALRAKNVVVLIDPSATPDDVQGTLGAVVELRRA